MNCRKCGAKQITRRKAGVFVCAHCGIQPGPFNLDRFGNATLLLCQPEDALTVSGYEFAERKPRLAVSFKGETPNGDI